VRRARLAGLTASVGIAAFATSACSLLTSLDGLSSGGALAVDGAAGADVGTIAAIDASSDASTASDTSAASDALDGGDNAGVNLHPQGSFETGTCAPWVGFQGTVEVVPTAHSGSGACRVCNSPSTTDYFTADDNSTPGPGTIGASYRAEAWVRADPTAPAPPAVKLFLRNSAIVGGMFTELEGSSSAPIVVNATWQRLEVTLPYTKAGNLNVFVGADAAPNACFVLDDVVLRRVN
jgi:hypothetical protein